MKTILALAIATALVAALSALPALASSGDGNGDRIPDRWEVRNNLSLSKNQAPRDQDQDGVRNLSEYQQGTDPRDADTDSDGASDSADERPCQPAAGGGPQGGTGSGPGQHMPPPPSS